MESSEIERPKTSQPAELLKKLIATVDEGQARVNKQLANQEQQIAATREATTALLELFHKQNAAYNIMREVVIKLFEDRYGSEGAQIPESIVN